MQPVKVTVFLRSAYRNYGNIIVGALLYSVNLLPMKEFSAEHIVGISTHKYPKRSQKTTKENYNTAICALNRLSFGTERKSDMRYFIGCLERTGITLDILDKLSFIHVSGTKGKGSTCAFTESILKAHGFKTGFYSSPHLISVRERIRINGQPISEEYFAKFFWKLYHKLQNTKATDDDMPPYFKFLTILCFHIFLEQRVDVSIVEVGIGGLLDCTNVIRNTKTVGITSLGLDHTLILGKTLPDIAYQKAGIIKRNCDVFTVCQPEGCIDIIRETANKNDAHLHIVPDLSDYNFKSIPKLDAQIQKQNMSLALQLAYDWLKKNVPTEKLKEFKISTDDNISTEIPFLFTKAVENCYWPGRCQVLQFHNKRLYLDGAHTMESLNACADWFDKHTHNSKNVKCLIFNLTGKRDHTKMLAIFNERFCFKFALFPTNVSCETISRPDIDSTDQIPDQLERSEEYLKYWRSIDLNSNSDSHSFATVLDAFTYLNKKIPRTQQADILITGSLHLIGSVYLTLEEISKQLTL